MKIIKKIKIELNKAYTHHCSFEIRQGDNGHYIQAKVLLDNKPFKIPEDFTAVFDAVVEDIVVAKDKPCEIVREKDFHYVLVPIDKTITTATGYIKLVVKLKKEDTVVSAQEISGEIVKNIDSNSTEDVYTPIMEMNEVLEKVVEGNGEPFSGIDTYRRDRLIPILEESKEALASKGVSVPEDAKYDFVPRSILDMETAGEYKIIAEAEKNRADTAEALVQSETKRANEATTRAETAETELVEETARANEAEALAKEQANRAELLEDEVETEKQRANEATERATAAENALVNETARANTAEENYVTEKQRADTAETEVERLEDELETVSENASKLEVDYNKLLLRETEEIVIPPEWTSIPLYTFANFLKLEKVTFHSNITVIEYQAFSRCSNLTTLNLPSEKPLDIEQSAFDSAGIIELLLPANVRAVKYSSFGSCNKLRKIIIEGVSTNVDGFAFLGSTNIEEVVLPQDFNSNGLNVSWGNKLTVESLVAMLEALADRTGQSAYTLTIGSANLAKLSDEQKAIATSKNWTLA